MEKYLYNAIKKYFNTLSNVGFVKNKDKWNIFVAMTVYSIFKVFSGLIEKKDIESLNKFMQCITKNSCYFGKGVPCLNVGANSLITIINSDIITDTEGTTLVSQSGSTRKFTDFAVQTEIQSDQYLVGYDRSENDEVAINVTNLGVFWDIDL